MRYSKAAALVAVLMGGVIPGPAQAEFAAPFWVSDGGMDAYADPQVGIDAGGKEIFCWGSGGDTVQARKRSAAGALGPLLTVSHPNVGLSSTVPRPQLAVNARGDAVFSW